MVVGRRAFFTSAAAAGAAAQVSILASGCAATPSPGPSPSDPSDLDIIGGRNANPYEYGAVGDGKNDDTMALRRTYEAVLAQGGGKVDLARGRFFIPGDFDLEHPGVSLVSAGGAVLGGGEVRIGPRSYDDNSGGLNFSGDLVSGITFDRGDDYGSGRCLVLRNVRGLDVCRNLFRSAGKGISVEAADGNEKFHTTAMLRIASNRFTKLAYGVYGDTVQWDRLSDWQISDNYFNYCSDTSVWIACSHGADSGGVDGLNFSGNTIFSLNHNASDENPLFARKGFNLRLGRTNWLRVINNNFFEAGLSAVYLEAPKHFTFVGNHVAWPGQREFGDALEIHGGSPIATVEGNTFALWTRAAIGLYELDDLTNLEIGQNAWNWSPTPNSWRGTGGSLPGYRIYATPGGAGYPVVRDFQVTGSYDEIKGRAYLQSRDIKTPKGGVSGACRRQLQLSESETVTVFTVSDIAQSPKFGGLISMTVTDPTDDAPEATYLLFVASQGATCRVIQSSENGAEEDGNRPKLKWKLSDNRLQVTLTSAQPRALYDFDAVGFGAVSLT